MPAAIGLPRISINPGPARATGQVVAHRGYRDDKTPGNTMASFERGIASGATNIEFDVRRLRDGELVVHHDPGVGFTPLASLTRAQLDQRSPIPVPSLNDVIGLAIRNPQLNLTVEMKEHGYEREALDRITAKVDPSRFVMMSFDRDVVSAVKQLRPDVRAGLIYYELPITSGLRKLMTPNYPIRQAQKANADFLAIAQGMAGEKFIASARKANLPLRVWTVDKPTQIKRLLPEVEAIITDYPDVALNVQEELSANPATSGR